MTTPLPSLHGASRRERTARLLASPMGVIVIVPLLIVAVGLTVLGIGRLATRDASESMARRQLAAQATEVRREVAFALDQAVPLVAALRGLADPALPIGEVAARMRELQLDRPGVVNVSIGFPSGLFRGTYVEGAEVRVQESRVGEHGTHRVNYAADGAIASEADTDYDVRTRPHYVAAASAKTPTWLPPHVYFTSKTTGVTLAAPVLDQHCASLRDAARPGDAGPCDGDRLIAVVTVDFDVGALGDYIAKSPLPNARTIVFAADGAILAVPGTPVPDAAAKENRVLRAADYHDPAIAALVAAFTPAAEQTFLSLDTPDDGAILASVAPIGNAEQKWYLATLVPEHTLDGPTRRFQRQTLVASGAALAIAVAIALIFAWNLARMQAAVKSARAELATAEARAKDLGSYRLMSKLGAGGMGEVWRAEHRLLARQAAIKLVRPETLRDPLHAMKMRERFRREAQTLAAMRSRNTIALHDYGVTDDGTFYFVMELLDGLDLDRLVKEHGPVPAARAIDILVQACNSLAEAHDGGLLHRDIKPANVFLARMADEVDVVKILDFGIVQHLREPAKDPIDVISLTTAATNPATSGRLTSVDAVVGTPGYIAPEAAFGAEVDARADLYALGCLAWWLLAGGEVFPRGKTDLATLDAHMYEDVPSLRDRVKGWMPVELEQLVIAMLAKRPQERPIDARTLAAELRAIAIPAEHAWTPARAKAWWYVHKPTDGESSASPPDAKTSTIERFVVTEGHDTVEELSARRDNLRP